MWPFLYNAVFPVLRLLAGIAAIFNPKIAKSFAGKKGIRERLETGLRNRDPLTPLIWFHAPSAGEFIQLQPLLETFLDSEFDCIVTFNSVSAQIWITTYIIGLLTF